MTNSSGIKWRVGGLLRTYNLIDNNIFDGRSSPRSNLNLGASNWSFTNNTVYHRGDFFVTNATDSLLQQNDVYAVDAAGALSTDVFGALGHGHGQDHPGGQHLQVAVLEYPDVPDGLRLANRPVHSQRLTNNTFVKNADDVSVYIATGSDAVVTGSQTSSY